MPAWDGENHWQGRVRADLLAARVRSRRSDFVASANEELYRRDGPPLHAHAQPDYRKRRIVERLTELPRATIEDMQDLQYDVLSVQARDLLPVLLASGQSTARSNKNSRLGTAVTRPQARRRRCFSTFIAMSCYRFLVTNKVSAGGGCFICAHGWVSRRWC